MRKAPGFTLGALLTPALEIGANAAIFTLVNAGGSRSAGWPDSRAQSGFH